MAEHPWPRLSQDLPHERRLDRCQSCGCGPTARPLVPWREHDDEDRPEPVAVVLCTICSDALVGPHPRFYRPVQAGEPFPGVMPCCAGCRHREALTCRHRDLKALGGPGLKLSFPPPAQAIVCSRDAECGLFGPPVEVPEEVARP